VHRPQPGPMNSFWAHLTLTLFTFEQVLAFESRQENGKNQRKLIWL